MKQLPTILFTLFFVFIASMLFCINLPQDPAQNPKYAEVKILIDDVFLHQGDEPRIGVDLFFSQQFQTISMTTSCGIFNTTFSTDTLKMSDTVYFRPQFNLTGPCTVFVNAQYKNGELRDKCDTLPLYILPRETTGIHFSITPSSVITVAGKTESLLFVTNASSGVTLPANYTISAEPSAGITLTPLYSQLKDTVRVVLVSSAINIYTVKVVVSAQYGNSQVKDSAFTVIRVNSAGTLLPSNVIIPKTISVGTTDTLFFIVDNNNRTDKLAIKRLSDSQLDTAVFTAIPTGPDSVVIAVTPMQAGTAKIGIVISNSMRDDTTWYPITMGTIDASLWNKTDVAIIAIEGEPVKHDLRQYFVKPQTGFVTFCADVGTVKDTAWEWTPAYGYGATASATITATNNTSLSQIKITISITSSDTTKPQLSLVDPTLDGKKVSSPQITVNCVAKDSEAGIGSVSISCGSTTIAAVLQQDSIYSGVVTGLKNGIPTEITITAVDKSMGKNSRTLTFTITYDTTIPEVEPSITTQLPATSQVIEGAKLFLTIVATGTPAPSYKWYKNNELLTGQTSAEFSKNNVTANDSGSYFVVVSNGIGNNVTSTKTVVTIRLKAAITQDPVATTVNEGGNGSFTVTAVGEGPLTYQWYKNGELITDATSTMYSIINAGTIDNGKKFTCVVSNSLNKDTSEAAVLTVTAKPVYKVLFVTGQGVTAPENQQVEEGGKVTQPTAPVRNGYEFGGWYKDSATTSAWNFTTDFVNSPVTLYAKWTQNSNTITFNKNDAAATGTMTAQTIASGSSAPLTTNGFTKTGWSFSGWATSATGTVAYTDGANYTMSTANVTLYAIWTQNSYTVTFNKNDVAATGTMSAQTIASGSSAPLTANAFTKTNWTFGGWATSATGTVAYTDGADYTMGTANLTLYAIWTQNSYTVTFNKNDAAATGTMAAQTIAGGSSAPLTANAFTKTGWAFSGWATSATGTVAYANGGSYTMGTANVTLYAKWTQNMHSITFNKNDAAATGNMAAQSMAEGATASLSGNSFTKPGWNFAGWATTAGGAAVYADQDDFQMGTANVTLYATWAPQNFTITFNKNDLAATGTMTVQTIACGSSAPLKVNSFAKNGWTFAGWATTSGGAVAYLNQASYTMGTAGITLYAKWTANLYTITFDKNSTSAGGIMTSQTIACGSQANLNPNGFSQSCESFVGWATTSTGTAVYTNQSPYTMGAANVTLYAVWAYPPMTVTPAYSQDVNIGGPGNCNPIITVSTSTCAASYEWHSVVFTDNILSETGPSITTENEWELNNYYCVVTDLSGNRITSGTWHVASCFE
jgi:uncharacterized repeat protein (TIGR02543 family)